MLQIGIRSGLPLPKWLPVLPQVLGLFSIPLGSVDMLLGQRILKLPPEVLRISVVIFPEGTRADPGSLHAFQIGGAYLASKSNVPVIPVAHNAGLVWPKGSAIKGPGVIRIVIGEPIMPGLRPQALNERVESWIRQQTLAPNGLK